jgi:hypothetical protein
MEKQRFPLVRIPPFGRRFSRHQCLPIRCDLGGARKATSTLAIIVSISPPGYPSAWLHPSIARFCFTWQSHCSSDRRWRFAGNEPFGRKRVIQPDGSGSLNTRSIVASDSWCAGVFTLASANCRNRLTLPRTVYACASDGASAAGAFAWAIDGLRPSDGGHGHYPLWKGARRSAGNRVGSLARGKGRMAVTPIDGVRVHPTLGGSPATGHYLELLYVVGVERIKRATSSGSSI